MWAIAKKDFRALFYSPIGYVVVAVFLAAMGIIMYLLSIESRSIDFNIVYQYSAKYSLPIISALLTMKSFSEEKSADTEKLLYTASRKTTSIIIGKILAVVMAVGVAIIISVIYCLLFAKYGAIDLRLIITILCFMLLTMAYASVGVMISSLSESQIISAILTTFFLILPSFFSYGSGVFSYLALSNFYSRICDGRLSINAIIVFVSFTITCILLTSIEMKRNRKFN
ncbi:MAG: ABC transporter permease [Clostridia bacterium]|nr:ABC transporter permease [Clostridia bacterium]